MLDKNRIKIMTRVALYEKKQGREDFKITTYYKKDYSSLNTLIMVLLLTIGYGIVVMGLGLINMDLILKNLNFEKLFFLGGAVITGYIILLIIYIIGVGNYYKVKHTKAKQRIKKYYRDLARIEKMLLKEKR